MGRPRTASDEQILAATLRAAGRAGPHQMTLADVARDVGVTASAIVQRFGSKRELLLAATEHAARAQRARFAEVRARETSPCAALVKALARDVEDYGSPADVGRSLGFLQLDLTDPDFRPRAAAFFESFGEEMRALIREAVARGELRADPVALARALEVAYNGSVIAWAVRGTGSASAAMRRDVEAVLGPHRLKPAAGRRGSPRTPAAAARRARDRAP